jgi:hypothetical protein
MLKTEPTHTTSTMDDTELEPNVIPIIPNEVNTVGFTNRDPHTINDQSSM